MSKTWGQTPITNADMRGKTQTKYYVETADGTEERIDRRPMGRVERFVDKAGNVCNLQIYADGDPNRHQSEIRMRAQYHEKGHVEFAKCPLKHGTRHSSPAATKDFKEMPEHLQSECRHDPKVMERRDGDLYAREACPHIEWLIDFRKKQAEAEYAKRNAHIIAAKLAEERERQLKEKQLRVLEAQVAQLDAPKKRKDLPE